MRATKWRSSGKQGSSLAKWSTEQYRADLERYQRERAKALAAGFAEDDPLVRMWTRRAAAAERVIKIREAEANG
jgi:hypothetical protein